MLDCGHVKRRESQVWNATNSIEAAERIADAAIADLRKQGLDCVSSGSYDDASRHIRMAIIRACADTFKEAAEVSN